MSVAIGQTVTTVITLRDELNAPITDLLEDDFATLEAFSVQSPATTVLVGLEEIDEGQYSLSYVPTGSGPWALHWVYDNDPVFKEDTEVTTVDTTAEIVVITSGGTWTYEGDLDDPVQLTRFLIQDTASDSPMFTDVEVAFALGATNNNARRAAASLVERLMARYASMADTTELDLSVRASVIYDHYKDLHTTLLNTFLAGTSVVPYAGGISETDVMANDQNTDRVRGIFDRRLPWRRWMYGGIR